MPGAGTAGPQPAIDDFSSRFRWHGACSSRSQHHAGGTMNRKNLPLSLVLFAGAGLLAATACASVQPESDDATSQEEVALETQAAPQGQPPRPRPCETSADCSQACPGGSAGCACLPAGPQGEKACVPTCQADADCPAAPHGGKLQCRQGACVPDPPPPRPPKACEDDAACSGACPPGAKGCACHATPHGAKVCAPTCGTDADCPRGDGIPPLSCKENFCVPAGPPPR